MRPGLRRFVWMPLLINVVVFAGLIWLGVAQFESLMGWLLPSAGSWWGTLVRSVLWIFFAVVTGLIIFFTFTIVANLIGAPFNGLLAQRLEQQLDGTISIDNAMTLVASIFWSLLNELGKLCYFLMILLFLFVLTLIPVVNIVAPFIWIIGTAWMLALEYLAYPMENHEFKFSEVRRTASANRSMTLGFGMAVMVATFVPFVNLTVMPASVAGATAMWVERKRPMG